MACSLNSSATVSMGDVFYEACGELLGFFGAKHNYMSEPSNTLWSCGVMQSVCND